MQLTREEIEQIATLARLELSEEEKTRYATQLSAVFQYIEMLNQVETNDVEETCQVTGLEDVVRIDEVKECDEERRKKLIELFPERKGNLLKVKAVFDSSNQ